MTAFPPSLLLIDPDPLLFSAAQASLDHRCRVSRSDGGGALAASATANAAVLSFAETDATALALLGELRRRRPELSLLAHLPRPDRRLAERARRAGADRVIEGPLDLATLRAALLPAACPDLGLIGDSPPLRDLRARIRRFAATPFPVLIQGEAGSGKEKIARALHEASPRAARPFLALNCAALPATLAEATLFGHARGAFTGADSAEAGFFEAVGEGSLLLDEIGELAPELQAKLLRVLEGGDFVRVGETRPRRFAGRLIAATNRDLAAMRRDGGFRADLLSRLAVLTLSAPPLRELGRDRLRLLDHFLAAAHRDHRLPPFRLAPDAEALWLTHPFPDNVRELRNLTLRLLAGHAGGIVDAARLRAEIAESAAGEAPGGGCGDDHASLLSGARPFDLDGWLAAQERALIEAALRLAGGRVGEAARRLGLKRATLYSRMERLFDTGAGKT